MKKVAMSLSFLFVFSLFLQNAAIVNAQKTETTPGVKLTVEQKKELESLYEEMFETKKQLINKYAEYGVITKEKAEEKLARLDKFQTKLKEHGYTPHWPHHGKKLNCDKNE
jgi:uncharacterized protein YktA (UPF0223 family)